MAQVTACALFYGDYPDIANRLLTSFQRVLVRGCPVAEIRFALNAVSGATRDLVTDWISNQTATLQVPGLLLETQINRFKYPMMRRLFQHRKLADLTMWMDDDTWWDATATPRWWDKALRAVDGADMAGQLWRAPLPSPRQRFFQTQPWWRASTPVRKHGGRPVIWFAQGAWWLIRSRVLRDHDWPAPCLKHNGGDTMLGELMHHQGLKIQAFDHLLHINADKSGVKSSSKRRGYSEEWLGARFQGEPIDLSHQVFDTKVKEFPCSGRSFTS